MDNFLQGEEEKIKREIYGFSILITPDIEKKAALMSNLIQYQLTTPGVSEEWVQSMEPYVDKLCAMPHVKVIPMPVCQLFELVEVPSAKPELHSKPMIASPHMVASFEGFVDQVGKDDSFNGIPKYYYIFTFMEGQNPCGSGSSKIVRYTSYVTPHRIIDGTSSLKKKTS